MKITWLNPEMTEALVTRGVLWWKRQAVVQRVDPGMFRSCQHSELIDGNRARAGMMCTLCCAVFGCLSEPVWQPVRPLPKARVIP